MGYIISRPYDGVTINSEKQSLYKEGKLLVFATVGEAEDYCKANGIALEDSCVEIEYIDGTGESELAGG